MVAYRWRISRRFFRSSTWWCDRCTCGRYFVDCAGAGWYGCSWKTRALPRWRTSQINSRTFFTCHAQINTRSMDRWWSWICHTTNESTNLSKLLSPSFYNNLGWMPLVHIWHTRIYLCTKKDQMDYCVVDMRLSCWNFGVSQISALWTHYFPSAAVAMTLYYLNGAHALAMWDKRLIGLTRDVIVTYSFSCEKCQSVYPDCIDLFRMWRNADAIPRKVVE